MMHTIGEETKTCAANKRTNICDTAKANSALIVDANCLLRNLQRMIEGPSPTEDGSIRADPDCLLAEVEMQNDMLGEMHNLLRRITVAMNG